MQEQVDFFSAGVMHQQFLNRTEAQRVLLLIKQYNPTMGQGIYIEKPTSSPYHFRVTWRIMNGRQRIYRGGVQSQMQNIFSIFCVLTPQQKLLQLAKAIYLSKIRYQRTRAFVNNYRQFRARILRGEFNDEG
ncbi:hypothetical protein ABPG72_013988 [Tetrahymena utriculariae]